MRKIERKSYSQKIIHKLKLLWSINSKFYLKKTKNDADMSSRKWSNKLNNTIFIDVEYKQYTFITIKSGFFFL